MSRTGEILIVDDEPNLRASLAMILERAGHRVTAASNAGEALQYLDAGPFDLVFLDLRMPETNGMRLLAMIREKNPDMPVLILTAHATLESAIEAVRKGARDYLLKPIDPNQILKRVGEFLSESEEARRKRVIVGELRGLLDELTHLEAQTKAPASAVASPTTLPSDPNRILRRGPFVLDLHARHLLFEDRLIPLSPTAFDYMITLVRHSPNPVSYSTLVRESQGFTTTPLEAREIARWRIHELRKAIEVDSRQPRFIITVRNAGYRLVT